MINHAARHLLSLSSLIWVAMSWPILAKDPLQDMRLRRRAWTGSPANLGKREAAVARL